MDTKIKKLYGLLKGIKQALGMDDYARAEVLEDYNRIVKQLIDETQEDLRHLIADPAMCYRAGMGGEMLVRSRDLEAKLLQTISYLECGLNLGENVIEVGSLYNSILDEELKGRCADLLTAPNNFDRVINQATLVLEDRIRRKAGADRALVGVQLVNQVMKTDIKKSTLVLSYNEDEQRGLCDICRGIMSAFRNPTHHYIENITREKALRICGFIDILLGIIDKSKKNNL